MRNLLAEWLEERRDIYFARVICFPLGSLGDEQCMWLARSYALLAVLVRGGRS